jgi:hypothetical protein
MVPTRRTASTPRLGSASRAGSEQAADAADRDLGVAKPLARRAERSVSSPSRPRVLTRRAPVEALVRDGADLAAQLLGAGSRRARGPLIDHVEPEDRREDEEAHDREDRVGRDHRAACHDEHREHSDRHGQRCDRIPGGLHVGVGVRQQLARRVAVVPRQREAEVLPGYPRR